MICKHCRHDLPADAFTASGAKRAQCRVCKAGENGSNYRAREPKRERQRAQHDRDDWARLRKPWPWAPGTPVFQY